MVEQQKDFDSLSFRVSSDLDNQLTLKLSSLTLKAANK